MYRDTSIGDTVLRIGIAKVVFQSIAYRYRFSPISMNRVSVLLNANLKYRAHHCIYQTVSCHLPEQYFSSFTYFHFLTHYTICSSIITKSISYVLWLRDVAQICTGCIFMECIQTPAQPMNPIVDHQSKAKTRRESNPKLVQLFPIHSALPSHCPIKQSLHSR